jgi:hypothetical protein
VLPFGIAAGTALVLLSACNNERRAPAPKKAPDENPATQMVREYLDQPRCIDRTAFVLDPEGNRSLIEKRYESKLTCRTIPKVIDGTACASVAIGAYCHVEVKELFTTYCVKRVADKEFKLDWRCSKGWNALPMAQFKADRPTTPALFRLRAELNDEYDHGFDKGDYQSVKLSPSRGKPLHGYLAKANQKGAALLELLADKKAHRVMVTLRYPKDAAQDGGVEILRLVQQHWRQLGDETGKASAQQNSGDEVTDGGAAAKTDGGIGDGKSAPSSLPTTPQPH